MTLWLKAGNSAVVTGAASGIGLAAAKHFRSAGMALLITDLNADALAEAEATLAPLGTAALHSVVCDVAEAGSVDHLATEAEARLGSVHCLMNNAGAGLPPALPWEALGRWKKQLDINLWGIVHGCQAFLPAMLAHGEPAAVINTGSKQGITNPPGNYAYNLSKAGVKAYTESLAHALRQQENTQLSAHLLIPGFTYTGMIKRFVPEQPAAAWSPEQLIEFMLASLARGDFYILCPDNETPRELDEKRILWNTQDLTENRSALSRWDPAYADAFDAFLKR